MSGPLCSSSQFVNKSENFSSNFLAAAANFTMPRISAASSRWGGRSAQVPLAVCGVARAAPDGRLSRRRSRQAMRTHAGVSLRHTSQRSHIRTSVVGVRARYNPPHVRIMRAQLGGHRRLRPQTLQHLSSMSTATTARNDPRLPCCVRCREAPGWACSRNIFKRTS